MIEFSLNHSRMAVAYFGLVGLVVCFSGHRYLAVLRSRLLGYTGQISYGLYLYHPIVFTAVRLIWHRLGWRESLAVDGLRVAASFAVASLSWRYIERPLLRLKDRFQYREPQASLAGPHRVREGVTSPRARS